MARRSLGMGKSSSRCMSAVNRATSLLCAVKRPEKCPRATADMVRGDLDAALADRRRPHQIDGEPGEMGQSSWRAARSIARQISAEGGPAC